MSILPTMEAYLANHLESRVPPGDELNCPICCDLWDYPKLEVVEASPECGHRYHKDCLLKWFGTPQSLHSNTCPNCRRLLFQHIESPDQHDVPPSPPPWINQTNILIAQLFAQARTEAIQSLLVDYARPDRFYTALQSMIEFVVSQYFGHLESHNDLNEAAIAYRIATIFIRIYGGQIELLQWVQLCRFRRLKYDEATSTPSPNGRAVFLQDYNHLHYDMDIGSVLGRLGVSYLSANIRIVSANGEQLMECLLPTFDDAAAICGIAEDRTLFHALSVMEGGLIIEERTPAWVENVIISRELSMIMFKTTGNNSMTIKFNY